MGHAIDKKGSSMVLPLTAFPLYIYRERERGRERERRGRNVINYQ
jgi:hypothetical protein